MSRLVVVSNRVPVPAHRGPPQAGGLAVALTDALTPGSLWFGWSGKCQPDAPAQPTVRQTGGITYATIDLDETAYRQFYVGFSNGALWPLLHFRLGLINFRKQEYEGYRAVNRAYAAALAPLLGPDDLVWVHDYHLIPLGQELRALGVNNRIGFFLHTPFVPPAMLATLPRATELLASLCTYDVVGFHTDAYRQAFLAGVAELLGVGASAPDRLLYRGHTVRAIVAPVGIDADGFARTAERAVRAAETRRLANSIGNRMLAIGVDRLDYAKGLPNRIEALACLLDTYPEHRRNIHFLQIAATSRADVGDYQRLRRELDRLVGDTNGRFSEFDWTPLRYTTRAIGRATLAGFFRLARVGVVTPLRDGMNLVAKEFVAAQDPADPGVLVLSRFAGAADDLTDALIVNPFDSEAVATAIHTALLMPPDERRQLHAALRTRVHAADAAHYCAVFLAALREVPQTAFHATMPTGEHGRGWIHSPEQGLADAICGTLTEPVDLAEPDTSGRAVIDRLLKIGEGW